ncbi:hypothetical protein BJV78DRAFT_1128023 [Lactifluus subvellereus]|nr:hypothetical protein BJV78DRAFT_1128023 [Lactifluus subvellereus]
MGRGVIYFIFQRPRFCCFLPVRACVIITSLLGFLLSGILSIILWFEITTAPALSSKERRAFIGGAIVELLFFFISIIGLIGAIVRKQTFVTAYAVGLYIHFLINFGVAMYFLAVILHATHEDTVVLCQHALRNPQSQDQCGSLFGAIRGVYAGLVSVVLVIELYSAIVATRYAYQVRRQKREARMPQPIREESDRGRLLPGFVRYKDRDGATVYDSYYLPPAKGHQRGVSEYTFSSTLFEGTTPMGLYDPVSAGLPASANSEGIDIEDGYHDDDHRDQEHEHGHDHNRETEPSPGIEALRNPHEEDSDTLR